MSDHTYQNPVGGISRIGDPFVLKASDGRYYLYPTSGFQVWSSDDLVHWRNEGRAKTNHSWGVSKFWAPEVVAYEGRYYMYYSAEREQGGLRIGVATSEHPTGPFVDVHDRPLFDFGWAAIDGHPFIDDDGRKYLYYARDSSTNLIDGRHESHLYVVELDDDMVTVKGEPHHLTQPDQPWEFASGPQWRWNEGPTVLKRKDTYYLMYSANFYGGRHYAVGYATSSSPLGPFTKYERNPIMEAAPWWPESAADAPRHGWWGSVSGSGHHSVASSPDGAEWFAVYHTHTDPADGGGNRQVNIDRMGFRHDGTIYINGPTRTPQPLPSGASDLYNLAAEATVEASSVKRGYRAEAVTDGEIGVDARFEAYDWVSEAGDEQVWVQLSWHMPRRARTVYLYDSAVPTRRPTTSRVRFSNGTVVDDVRFPSEPGAAAIIEAPDVDIEWLRFEVIERNGRETGLSEMMVFGYPPDSVSSPS